jgi:hypothetical protein
LTFIKPTELPLQTLTELDEIERAQRPAVTFGLDGASLIAVGQMVGRFKIHTYGGVSIFNL